VRPRHRTRHTERRHWRLLLVTALTGFVIMVGAPTATAASGWIDGGDDLPCVDDETCLWIEGCTLDGNNNPVYPNHNGTFVGSGPHGYKSDTPTPAPTQPATPKPSTKPTTKPSTPPSTKPISKPSTKPSSKPTKPSAGSSSDGPYRAQVVAQYADGVPETSPVSQRTSIGENPRKVLGTVAVTGDVVAGGSVTVSGDGFAGDVSGFQVEIHSDPIVLASVATDADGAFVLEATVPDTLEPGDHSIVVLYDNVEVASTPVTVSAPEAAPAAAISTPTAGTSTPTTQGGAILLLGLAGVGVAALVGHEIAKRRRPGRPVTA